MIIESAEFIASASDAKMCPKRILPEFAFVGRSNVGKSSLINMLTEEKNLAHTSSKPGKTQLINHFLINDRWFLVDLPGYGYAKVSKTIRAEFGKLITDYITTRENMYCLFVLIDSRLEPQQIDLDFVNWLGQNGVPFVLAFTKTDKISKLELAKNAEQFKNKMMETWDDVPQMFFTSADNKKGRDEILKFIAKTSKK